MDKDAKNRLIEAAMPLFPAKGYAGVSIREIAEAAHVNSAAISYYFGGKEGLYEAVLDFLFSQIDDAIHTIDVLQEKPQEFIRHFAMMVLNIHMHNPYIMLYLYQELSHPSPYLEQIIQKHISKAFNTIHIAISKGISAGIFKKDINIEHAVMSLAGIINFYFFMTPVRKIVLKNYDDNEKEYVQQAISIFLNGIRRDCDEKKHT